MALSLLSVPPLPWPPSSLSLITSHSSTASSCSAVRTPPPPSPSFTPPPPLAAAAAPPQLAFHNNPDSSSAAPLPPPASLTCALHCPHFQSCSGCTQEYNLHRPVILDEAANFFKKLGVSDFSFHSCKLWGWRCRAKLAVRGSSAHPLIGLYQEGTHNVVDIPECKAHHPSINAAVELLKQGMIQLNIDPYDEDQGTGELRYVQMAVTTHNTSLPFSERYNNGKVQVSLVWNSRNEKSPSSEKLNALASFLWRNGGPHRKVHLIHSVWANFQTSTNNIIFGHRWRHLLGEQDFWEHVGGIDVYLAPSSFGQANTRAFDVLLRKLQKYVPYGASVADLYAGAGVIGLSLAVARKCRKESQGSKSVKCVEVNKEAKLSFERTAERLPNSIDSSISWHHADASIDVIIFVDLSPHHLKKPHSWLVGSDVVVVDPPRKGLDPSLVNMLQTISSMEQKAKSLESPCVKVKEEKRPWVLRARKSSVQIASSTAQEGSQSLPQTLIYISCGWESFRQDCMSLLSSKAWHLNKAHGFNFFPGTQSMEILAVFKRGPGESAKKKKSAKRKKKPS